MAARHWDDWASLRQAGSIGGLAGTILAAVLAVAAIVPAASASWLRQDAVGDGWGVVFAADQGRAMAKSEESRALAAQGRLEDALARAEEALALAKREFGNEKHTVAFIYDYLAKLAYGLRDLERAEGFSQEAVRIIREGMPDSTEAALLEQSLGTILAARGQYCRARPLYEHAHATLLAQRGAEHELTAAAARELGIALLELSEPAQALPYFKEATDVQRALFGERSVAFARASLDLASAEIALEGRERLEEARQRAADTRGVLEEAGAASADLAAADIVEARAAVKQAALAEAEALLEGALQGLRAAGKHNSPLVGHAFYYLGFVNILRGRFIEAQPLYHNAIEAYQRAVGPRHPVVARSQHQLAMVYQQIGQYEQAEASYRAALDIYRESNGDVAGEGCGPNPAEAATLAERAVLHADRGKFEDAESDALAALAIYQEAEGDWSLREGFALSALGHARRKLNRLLEAKSNLENAIELIEGVRGPHASDLAPGLNELALIALERGRPDEAERQARRAVEIRENDAALTPWGFARAQTTLAVAIAAEGRQDEALREIREATKVMRRRLTLPGRQRDLALGESLRERDVFERHLEIAYRLYEAGDQTLRGEIVEVLQYPHLTGTAMALHGVAARFADAEGPLPELVRARQRAIEEWTARDQILLELLSSSEARPQDLAARRLELAAYDAKIGELDRQLEDGFPQFAEFTRPRPVAGQVLQKALRPSEAMLIQVTADNATYLALVTPVDVLLARTDLGSDELAEHVKLLRTAVEVRRDKDIYSLRGFDVARAHRLYQMTFAPFAEQFEGLSTLFFVPDGAMQNITPAVLLMEPAPEPAAAYSYFDPGRPELFEPLRNLRFLALEVPIAVLPSPGSLQSLRQLEELPDAEGPFVGFAPLVWGDLESASDMTDRGPVAENLSKDGSSLDVRAFAQRLKPLTEAEEELRDIAQLLGADPSRVVLGAAATERAVKSLPPRAAQVVVFATHAVITGEFGGIAEPALIMHLAGPGQTDGDDGVLFASEVAELRLQADWVILSACNTAAPVGRPGAEGLSGLARAFFYAGTRSLLVSHWWVNSPATVKLTTGAVRALRDHPESSRAEALRTSMREMARNSKNPIWSHPYFWAPFTVVGAAN